MIGVCLFSNVIVSALGSQPFSTAVQHDDLFTITSISCYSWNNDISQCGFQFATITTTCSHAAGLYCEGIVFYEVKIILMLVGYYFQNLEFAHYFC